MNINKRILCVLLSLSLVAGCITTGSILPTTGIDDYVHEVLNLTNVERTKIGLNPLTWNDNLAEGADAHCKDMVAHNFFAHEGSDGSTPGDRATAAGYKWSWVGENIAKGQKTPQEVVTAWMNSEHHRENILRPEFTELGVALEYDSSGTPYWGQLFGTPYP